jgi:leishmanolysin
MIFDRADLNALERQGQLGSLVLHEMGHVLGIGTIWARLGLLQNASSATSRLDTYFSGDNALAGFHAIGGAAYAGQKVPVENGGGSGTMNSHWRESVLQDELMTGYLGEVRNPLSVLTVRSLADLGYTVDPAGADAFSLGLSLRAGGAGPQLHLHNDVYTGPRYVMDRNGRRTRIR